MNTELLLELLKFGVSGTIAVAFVYWLLKIDIPQREKRHAREREDWLAAFREDRRALLEEFRQDRKELTTAIQELGRQLSALTEQRST